MLKRKEVYELVEAEINRQAHYQPEMKKVGEQLLVIEELLFQGRQEWFKNGDAAALYILRKIAAEVICTIENHG